MSFKRFAALCAAMALSVAPGMARAQTTAGEKPTIVLVHGAWADASSYDAVIARLQKAGYKVFAPPNELRSLATDAREVANLLKTIVGPVILVGHSYGGAVISVASAESANVKALVYVDAFVPDAGESPLSLLAPYPAPPKDFFVPVPMSGGGADVYIAQKYYGPVFASDVPAAKALALAAEQRPITGAALNEKAPAGEGWKTIPSWYVVGDADLVIPPALQIKMAMRAKAHVSHTHGSHPSMIEHPDATVDAIEAAAAATATK
jgi:pimeloyl-ACP methyl ester carboxylesterase